MAEPDKGQDKMPDTPPVTAAKKKVVVEVMVDNLGPKLLKRGTMTSDPQIAHLLNDPRKLVREVGKNC